MTRVALPDGIVDCMSCLANAEAPDLWPHTDSGPRGLEHGVTPDARGVSHAFVRSASVPHRGWWKCDFSKASGTWRRNWNETWDP